MSRRRSHSARRLVEDAVKFEHFEPRKLLSVAFDTPRQFFTDNGEAVAVADFDQDGFQDIVVGAVDRPTISVFFGDPTGSFANRTFNGFTEGIPVDIAVDDFNGDTFIDIVVATRPFDDGVTTLEGNLLQVFLADGVGSFRPPSLIFGDGGGDGNEVRGQFALGITDPDEDLGGDAGLRAISSVDAGPDGDIDIFFASDLEFGQVVNDSGGRFDGTDGQDNLPDFGDGVIPPQSIESDITLDLTAVLGRDIQAIVREDLVNDLAEVYVLGQDLFDADRGALLRFRESEQATPFPGQSPTDGPPDFVQSYDNIGFTPLDFAPSALAVADLNNDGVFDAAIASETEDSLRILLSFQGGFGQPQVLTLGGETGANDVGFADLDGDGDQDLVAGTDDGFVVYENLGGGVFSAPDASDIDTSIGAIAFIRAGNSTEITIVGISDTDDTLILQDVTLGVTEIVDTVPAGSAVEADLRGGTVATVGAINSEADPILFFGGLANGFQAANAADEAVTSALTGPFDQFTDPKDGLSYIIGETADGIFLFRDNGTFFEARDLSRETFLDVEPTQIEAVVSSNGLVTVILVDESGDLFVLQQTGAAASVGFVWSARNITQNDLFGDENGSPVFVSNVEGFATPWGAINFVGLDSDGQVQAVWFAPGLAGGFDSINLSEIANAPTFASGLAAFVTPWSAINIVGTDEDGQLVALWWVPQFGSSWAIANLSEIVGDDRDPGLIGSTLTGFTTPGGAINIVGTDADGTVFAFWWAPNTGVWNVTNLSDAVTNTETPPTFAIGPLNGTAGVDGTIYIFGTTTEGDAATIAFSGATFWQFINLSETAIARG
ncbi:MAG: VCBS repeat-containing protein [Planctomycetota bacterium]